MMRWLIDDTGRPLDGILLYVESEHSFRFDVSEPQEILDRSGDGGTSSLSIGTLQVEVGIATGIVLFVWGFHPRTQWVPSVLESPRYRSGLVRVTDTPNLGRGISLDIPGGDAWSTRFDATSGWIVVSKGDKAATKNQVLVANGIILGFEDSDLRSVWLQPVSE